MLLLALVACGGDEEAKLVLARIDRMRDAPIAERAEHIRALAQLTPEGAPAARARQACLAAYEQLQAAHEQAERSSARIAQLQSEGRKPRYEEIAAADRAVSATVEARKAEPACAQAVADLRRTVR